MELCRPVSVPDEREEAPQRDYALRDVFNALRYLAHTGTGCPWRYLPHDLLP